VRWLRRRGTAGSPPASAAGPMRRALHLVLAGDLSAAEGALAEAARIDSSSADVYLALANLYRARGEVGRAIQIHQNLLLRQELPEELRRECQLGLALDFRAGGFLRRAAASFEELLEVDRRNLQALRELERIRVESGEWEEAIRIRRRIGSADASTQRVLAHLFTGLGRSLARDGRAREARKAFRRALGRDRRCAEAYLALGDQLMREGRPARAVGLWRRALPLHPAAGLLVYPRLWEAHAALDDFAALERALRERVDAQADDAEGRLWLARALVRQGRVDEALAELSAVLERAPGHLGALAETGRVLLQERRELDALKAFGELLERLPLERARLRCRSCGTQDSELHWRCPQCGEWDTF
jgi:lipopolysaccharide biosynthesis regulator YciM